jgi:hypothetical protein
MPLVDHSLINCIIRVASKKKGEREWIIKKMTPGPRLMLWNCHDQVK